MANCNNCGHTALLGYNECEYCSFIMCNGCNIEYNGFYVVDVVGNHMWFCSDNCILMTPQYIDNSKKFNNLKKQQQMIQDQIEKELIRPLLQQHIINDLCNIVNEYLFTE